MKNTLKTLSFSIALVLPIVGYVTFADDKPVDTTVTTQPTEGDLLRTLSDMLGKPNAHDGLITTNQHIYYAGDRIDIEVKLPSNLRPFLEKTAQLQLLLHISPGNTVATFPVVPDGKFFEGTIDTTELPPGIYQLGLVLVKPNGDASKVSDWVGGYGALLSTTRLKISERASADSEDIGDGLVEGDTDGDGYVDLLVGDRDGCSNAILKGTYGYIVSGLTKNGEYLKDYLEMGFDIFDGKGGMTTVYTDALNRATYQAAATYNIDKNCRGTVTYDDGGTFSMFVPPSGNEFYYLVTGDSPGESFGGREHRLTKRLEVNCSAATLKGVYSYAARGVKRGVLWIETGFEYFDGKGNVVNTYTNNISKETQYARGTYSVDSNCLGVTTYPDDGTVERYAMFVSPTGSEFSWIQIDGLQLLGLFGGVDNRSARSVESFKELADFAASGTPVDPNITANMVCNIPAPADVPAGVEIKCGEGYELINNGCQLAPESESFDPPLTKGPAALCPAGIMLKSR